MLYSCLKFAETFKQGTSHHKNIQDHLGGIAHSDITPTDEYVAGYWKSMDHVWPDISQTQCTEEWTEHPHLGYRGIVDCVAHYK